MVARSLLSEGFGLLLTCLMVLCLAIAVHDDRASSPPEQVIAYGSMGLLGAWLIAKGLVWWHADRKRSG